MKIDHFDFFEKRLGPENKYAGYECVLKIAGAEVHAYKEFGSYQGDWLAKVTYNGQTGWIMDSYGSCSGCDALESELGWKELTEKQWEKKIIRFAKDYLDDIRTFDDVLKLTEENISWDLDAKEMVEWLKKNK